MLEENRAYCPQRCLWLTDPKKEFERENLCFWLVSSPGAVAGDSGCVAQGHLAGLKIFEHSVSDLGNYCKLDASSWTHITPRRFTLKSLVLSRPLPALPLRNWEPSP